MEKPPAVPKGTGTYYWVDVICINQNNLKERANKVLRMKRMYEYSLKAVPHICGDTKENRSVRGALERLCVAETREYINALATNGEAFIKFLQMPSLRGCMLFKSLWSLQESSSGS